MSQVRDDEAAVAVSWTDEMFVSVEVSEAGEAGACGYDLYLG